MDEPFGAVDEIARRRLQEELKAIHKKLKKTILFVTHDIEEALKLGTKIILLNHGQVEQQGTKEDLIFSPVSDFVKNFFGLKGFKASLDENMVNKLYQQILSGEIIMEG
jgi:osmoprotectant transport system ATP-binding protein